MQTKKIIYQLIALLLILFTSCSKSSNNSTGKLLLISFDGFRYDYLSKTETPNFDRFISIGVMAESLIPVVPTKTFPNHYSIVTGLYPENSGLVGNTMYDPEWDEWYRISDREAVANGDWYQGEPIWNTAERQGLTTGTMFWIGSEAEINGMRPTYWKKFDAGMNNRARIDTVVSWFVKQENPIDFGTLYFGMVDSQGHQHGPASDSLVVAVQEADQLLGYLVHKLQQKQLWDKMNVLIVSDHGMTELSADKIITLDSLVNMDDIQRYILEPVTMIQPDSGKVEQVYQQLKRSELHYTVYRKEELPERYHLKNHSRVMDIIMLADIPYTILKSEHKESFINNLPQGTHGYDNINKDMHGIFAARGPSFTAGNTVSPFELVHLYELMAHLLELEPAPNEGSLDSIKTLLK
ncbi:ectonucleotide pyrophosphatase/phosphodiesterase [Aliifodinibius sp. S!AR15-10]|uniref:alkaline phosphatase family protein n=1 Tax=Aliifodinibius sp. S!AR15-10 TaxID=2950437 RepID=UPI00285BEC03|nr:ectonucleotide pyrophosphatase/phosphodiesterase [Aliifodinibius sp. S!AR15-10]MDR8392669.1 ectonucleotide pyrophosphatase/phosphodiesterase [Aliifodinibius sp. S!AR15-10]